jgi:hypothetical protein
VTSVSADRRAEVTGASAGLRERTSTHHMADTSTKHVLRTVGGVILPSSRRDRVGRARRAALPALALVIAVISLCAALAARSGGPGPSVARAAASIGDAAHGRTATPPADERSHPAVLLADLQHPVGVTASRAASGSSLRTHIGERWLLALLVALALLHASVRPDAGGRRRRADRSPSSPQPLGADLTRGPPLR